MDTTGLQTDSPPTMAEEKRENQFERALADPDTPSPYHLSVYTRTFLGGLLFFSLVFFYIIHLSGYGSLGTFGQAPYPPVNTHLTNH